MFMDALIKGDYEAYKQGDNNEIYPIFNVDKKIRQSPLINLRIIMLLNTVYSSNRTVEEKHLNIQSIVDYLDAIGCSELATESALKLLLEAGLIEPYDVSNRSLSIDQSFSISHRGKAHLRLASHNSVFFYQMALTTPVIDNEISLKIKNIYNSNKNRHSKYKEIKTLFLDYLIFEDAKYINIQQDSEQYNCQIELLNNLMKFKQSKPSQANDVSETFGTEYELGSIKLGVLAIVDFYDVSKRFGFVEVDGIDSKIYIHADKLSEYDINFLKDGDSILCDLVRGPKGFYIDKIHDVEVDQSEIEIVVCYVVRLFEERGYGFAKVDGKEQNVFFHISVFPQDIRRKISIGQQLRAEIGPDKKGDSYQIKRIIM